MRGLGLDTTIMQDGAPGRLLAEAPAHLFCRREARSDAMKLTHINYIISFQFVGPELKDPTWGAG